MTVNPATTSVPHWSPTPALDPGGARRLVLAAGAAGEFALGPDGSVPEAAFATAVTGDRFVLIGNAAEIARARAELLAAGAIPAEITEVLAGAPDPHAAQPRTVYCPHCHTGSTGAVAIGATLPCANCGLELVVYHRYSQRLGAFLGYCADAEERP
ncbi:dimethylamine monooxygenase subunit DmmA family protein [Nocardia sp. NPDC050697]|uniref:dimethylamine monooxygenase subunit DmmA family protein n=1 Tax=Nocardia sp. NPDC050697 TaxID=3155158 RepID=UPI0033F4283D